MSDADSQDNETSYVPEVVQCDYDAVSITGSVLEQKVRILDRSSVHTPVGGSYYESSLPNLAAECSLSTNSTQNIYLVKHEPSFSVRKWLVGPYCFLYMAAYITSYYAFIQYVYAKVQKNLFSDVTTFNVSGTCNANLSSDEYKRQTLVQQHAANWSMYYSLAAGIPSIFSNIVLGSSTDKYGRKFLFFMPGIGTFIKTVVFVIGIYLNLDLKFFLIGFFIEGLTGQMFTMLLVSFTYVADITSSGGKNRSFGITLIELSIGIAVAVFSFTTGYFIADYGFFYPMLSSGVMVAGSVIAVTFIPETFPKEKRNANESVLVKLRSAYDLFFGSFNRGRRWMYNILLATFTLAMFTVFGRSSVEPLYQLGTPFCWSSEKLGYYGGLKSLLQQMVGMGMVKVMQKIMSDEAIAMFGCLSFAAAYILEGFAKTDVVMYFVPVIGAWGLLTVPMCRSILSGLTRSDQQGAIFAAIAAMETAINLGASLGANTIYSHTAGFYRGFVFFVFAGCCVLGFILLWLYRIGTRRSRPLFLEIN